jgi:hypothetical protein
MTAPDIYLIRMPRVKVQGVTRHLEYDSTKAHGGLGLPPIYPTARGPRLRCKIAIWPR